MGEIPERQRAGGLGGGAQGAQIVQGAAAVIDLREHQHRDLVVQRGPVVGEAGAGGQQAQLVSPAQLRDQPLGDVEIGGTVVGLAQDHPAFRTQAQGHRQQLVEIHRGGIGHHHLPRCRAQQRRQALADPQRRIDPAGTLTAARRAAVPAADQAFAPLFADHPRQALRGGTGQHAQGIAVQIDLPGRQVEAGAQRRERVGGVEGEAGLAG